MNKSEKTNDKSAIIRRASWSGGWATLRDLEIIQTVIDAGSVTAAAERLGVSQPAVSRALNQIEARCGRPLFHRENNRLIPCADALLLYEEIGLIAESFSRLSQFRQRERKRQFRVLVPPTIAYGFLNQMTAQFMREHPYLRIHLEIVRSGQILQSIARDEADVAVADAIAENYSYNFSQIPIRKTQVICALPAGHPLCVREQIRAEDLHQQKFIALIKNNIGRGMFDRALNKVAARPDQIAEVSDLETACIFVREGLGVSLISAFPLLHSEGIEYREFLPHIQSTVACFTKKNVNSDIQAYIEFIRARQPPADRFSQPV